VAALDPVFVGLGRAVVASVLAANRRHARPVAGLGDAAAAGDRRLRRRGRLPVIFGVGDALRPCRTRSGRDRAPAPRDRDGGRLDRAGAAVSPVLGVRARCPVGR
jgi:hypothetical protein